MRIDHVRLAAAHRAAEAPLPFPAASLTRKSVDTALHAAALAAGVNVQRGLSITALNRTGNTWQATLDDGTIRTSATVFLATGKHDLRGHARPKDPHHWVAFKMYYRLAPAQAAELAHASELMLYPGGYGGIQPVEEGMANLCCVVQKRFLPTGGSSVWESFVARMQLDCPHLAMRLAGAEPLLEKPIAISHIPYGYIRPATEDGLYCIGDQAAVIPSFTGDGISIALHTARCAATAYLAGESAPAFQKKMHKALRAQMRLAEFAADGLNNPIARAVLPFCLRVWPGVMRVTARLTRVAQHAAPHTPAIA